MKDQILSENEEMRLLSASHPQDDEYSIAEIPKVEGHVEDMSASNESHIPISARIN